MTEPVVITDGLTRRFGDFVAVDHVTFQVNPGEGQFPYQVGAFR